ncbi:MAG: hypothetical protein LQ350_002562 [Teloschistes chrysophthalmus]|nr:MAG: hypothetical protein LQ350_002562 [Niorma chrysophthalma]
MYKHLDGQLNVASTRTPTMTPVISIQPESIWNALKKYRNFMMNGGHFSVHEYAMFLRRQPLLPKEPYTPNSNGEIPCIGRILEIRAKDPQHVYVRVYWLYRPEDLSEGRQMHHGKYELIATNHMEIVDALRCMSLVEIIYLAHDIEPPQNRVYWRQHYNFMLQKFSVSSFS